MLFGSGIVDIAIEFTDKKLIIVDRDKRWLNITIIGCRSRKKTECTYRFIVICAENTLIVVNIEPDISSVSNINATVIQCDSSGMTGIWQPIGFGQQDGLFGRTSVRLYKVNRRC